MDLLPQLALVAFLVVLNAAFAGTEMALVSLREGQLQRLERASGAGAVLASLAREPNRFLATIQIGITLAGFLASAAAAVSLAEPLVEPLGFLGGAAGPVSIVVVTLLLAYLTLVFGELAPKRVAMQRAERWGLLAARPLAFMSVLTRPVVWLLSHSTDLAVRMMGADPERQRAQVTEGDLRDMVAAQTSFTDHQRMIIVGAFEISERRLREVVRPRPDVVVVAADATCDEAIDRLVASSHTRAPVAANGDLDEVTGFVHIRDLVGGGARPVGELATDLTEFPETLGVLDAMHRMQTRHTQMAVVVNEHGAVEGIVTMEDLMEEIVGEIYDESDPDVLAARREDDGAIVLEGSYPVHDLVDLGIEGVPAGQYTTVAGLVIDQLNRIPDAPGDVVTIGGWTFEVLAVRKHTVAGVRVRPTWQSGAP
ncbi:MAG: HlyC/CorC family transporter [Acidimicrobiia bacterium]|nr:HlyC/CorC family transporter [Acidimicrobiia bacterium]